MSLSSFQITHDQVKTFQSDATNFKEKFKMEGPASVGTDLDKGEAFSTRGKRVDGDHAE